MDRKDAATIEPVGRRLGWAWRCSRASRSSWRASPEEFLADERSVTHVDPGERHQGARALSLPFVYVAIVALAARHRRRANRSDVGVLVWIVMGLMAVLVVLGAFTVGPFIAPIAVFVLLAINVREGPLTTSLDRRCSLTPIGVLHRDRRANSYLPAVGSVRPPIAGGPSRTGPGPGGTSVARPPWRTIRSSR